MTTVIADYGLGNLFSLQRVIRHLGGQAVVSGDPAVVAGAPRLILPGVGAFADGMANLKRRGLDAAIKDFAAQDKPLLGICLGMQLLMSESEENGRHPGLAVVPGRVIRFQPPPEDGERYKIPHVGWNTIRLPAGQASAAAFWDGTLLAGCADEEYVYFVHSYTVVPDASADILAETCYGRDRFCSVLRRGRVNGCQFHPEISSRKGLEILRTFLELPCRDRGEDHVV